MKGPKCIGTVVSGASTAENGQMAAALADISNVGAEWINSTEQVAPSLSELL